MFKLSETVSLMNSLTLILGGVQSLLALSRKSRDFMANWRRGFVSSSSVNPMTKIAMELFSFSTREENCLVGS
jgi:hypothetical protein